MSFEKRLFLNAKRGESVTSNGQVTFSSPGTQRIRGVHELEIEQLLFPRTFDDISTQLGNNEVGFIVYGQSAAALAVYEPFNPANVDHVAYFKFNTALTRFRTSTVDMAADLAILAAEINAAFNASAYKTNFADAAEIYNGYTLNVALAYDASLDRVTATWTGSNGAFLGRIRFQFVFGDFKVVDAATLWTPYVAQTVNVTNYTPTKEGFDHILGASLIDSFSAASLDGITFSSTGDFSPSLTLVHSFIYVEACFLPTDATSVMRFSDFSQDNRRSVNSSEACQILAQIPLIGSVYGDRIGFNRDWFSPIVLDTPIMDMRTFTLRFRSADGGVLDLKGNESFAMVLKILYTHK